MLKLRLQRVGRKNDPSFRVVVTESQNGPQSGKFLEVLGAYDARQGVPQLKGDRIKHWIAMGAQVSDTMHNMLVRFGVVEGKKVNNLPKMKPVESKPEPVSAPVAEAALAEAKAEEVAEPVEEKVEEVAPTEEAATPEAEPVVEAEEVPVEEPASVEDSGEAKEEKAAE